MSAIKSFLLAIEVATRHREDAGKALMYVQRSCRDAQDQMEQLESYAADTESKWALGAQVSAAPEIVRHYYQFMDRLQQAIELQRHAVADLDRQASAARKLLLDADIRVAGLNQVLEKKKSGIQRLMDGRERKEQDEFAAMQHRRQRPNFDIQETP